jgi:hypothetical protein
MPTFIAAQDMGVLLPALQASSRLVFALGNVTVRPQLSYLLESFVDRYQATVELTGCSSSSDINLTRSRNRVRLFVVYEQYCHFFEGGGA